MIPAVRLACIILLSSLSIRAIAQPVCLPTELRCEHLNNPLGIDDPQPRLTWQLQDARKGARQTAYQVIVGTDSLAVRKGTGNCWQTGPVQSDGQLVTYHGKPLQPFTRYYYAIQVWDKE